MKRKFGIQTFKEDKTIKSGKVSVAPYGGMFFHKNLIDSIGYPNEEFYLYADDHEWSYRITKNSGDIYLVLDSLVDDIDTSWHVKSSFIPFINYLYYGTDFRVYYAVRNRVKFEINDLLMNKTSYLINKYLLLLILKFFSVLKSPNKYKIVKKAIFDADNVKLGKRL
jgi:GT2 family glycosyltransferase